MGRAQWEVEIVANWVLSFAYLLCGLFFRLCFLFFLSRAVTEFLTRDFEFRAFKKALNLKNSPTFQMCCRNVPTVMCF